MPRTLFCERGPVCYRISVAKEILLRDIKDIASGENFCERHALSPLPVKLYAHRSLLMRTLGDVDLQLQKNKAVNLSIAAPLVSNVVIEPGESFSFWRLVGNCTPEKGYLDGLVICANGSPGKDTGGGMCQMTNLIHWLVLHSPLEITEHHHHPFDFFPDYGRSVPFGTGTSIFYNYVDYRFRNNTDQSFQLVLWLDGTYLNGELRCETLPPDKYHIREYEHYFYQKDGEFYRHNRIMRDRVDRESGNVTRSEQIIENNAKVLYSPDFIPKELIRT